MKIKITGEDKKKKKRLAKLEIKISSYNLSCSNHIIDKSKYPKELKIQAIKLKEHPETVLEGEEPIVWRLLTSEPIEDFDNAVELIECYTTRWYIEEAFRLLKTVGFDIESTELESGSVIRKLLIMAMEASI